MKKSDYIKKINAERGEDFYDKNKSWLDPQFEYIESIGDPDDIKKNSSSDDVLISTGIIKDILNK